MDKLLNTWSMEVKSRWYKQFEQNPNKQRLEQQERVSQQGMGRSTVNSAESLRKS